MRTLKMGKGVRVVAAVATILGSGAIGGLALTSSANADPAWGPASKPLVAVGSNTIEDLFDAFAGVVPTPGDAPSGQSYHTFTPLADPSTGEQVYSWNANNENGAGQGDCISTKPGFAPIARPNGSGDGHKALSDAITNTNWSKTTSSGSCAALSPAGMIDMSRSSSAPSGSNCASATSTCLAWIDFAHDAVSYAYYIGSGATTAQVDHLTNAQLTSLYSNTTTGTFTDTGTGVTYLACLPQLGSGTEKFFVGTLAGGTGISTSTAEAAAKAANCHDFEENGANTFQSFGASAITADSADVPAPTVAITPFSVGSWISQSNGIAFNRSSNGQTAGVKLGYTDGSGSGLLPYSGTAPSETPNSTFYSSAYGRDLFVVTNNASLNGRATAISNQLRDLFGYLGTAWATFGGPQTDTTTSTGAICGSTVQTTELPQFGFTTPTTAACGAEWLTVTDPAASTGS